MFARLKPIWTLTAGHRARYGAAIVALLLATCFLYLAPLIPQIIIDGVLLADGETPESRLTVWGVRLLGGREFLAGNLWWPALLMVVLTSIAGLFTFARGRWSATASEGIVRSVRDRAYDHLQHLPCSYFDTAQTGDLIQRCTSDVETLRTFLSTQVVEIGRAAVMLLVPIPLMLAIDVRMTVMALVLIPFILSFSLIYFRRIRAAFKAMDEAEGRLSTVIQENLTGIRVVRAFARQEFEQEKLAVVNRTQRDLDYRLFVELARFWSGSDLLCFGQKGFVVGVGAYLLATGRLRSGRSTSS